MTEFPVDPATGRPVRAGSAIPNIGDWRFNRYLTMQLLPLFYVLLVFGSFVVIASLVVACFYLSVWLGLVAAIIGPIMFLLTFAIIRAALEYLIMAHRIMRIIERMDSLPDQVSDLSERVDHITGHVDQLIAHVDEIHGTLMDARPFLRSAGLPARIAGALRRRAGV